MANYMDELIRSVRVLAAEQVEAARSGHPGTPLGIAPEAAALFADVMKIVPSEPTFFDRDRFVLSSGHASAMLYAVLHCVGYDIGADDLKHFRGYDSITPGIPKSALRPAWIAPRARSGRAWQTPWGWRWRKRSWRRATTSPTAK